jgi:uncharacterized protein YneF (UPF0154 family)
MSPFDAPETTLQMLSEFISKSSVPDVKKNPPVTTTISSMPHSSKLPIHEPSGAPKSPDTPSHFVAAIFVFFFMLVTIFGGLYLRRKLRTNRPDW